MVSRKLTLPLVFSSRGVCISTDTGTAASELVDPVGGPTQAGIEFGQVLLCGAPTANFRTKILDFRGFDSNITIIGVNLRGGTLMSIMSFPEISSQQILAGIILAGKLGLATTLAPRHADRRARPAKLDARRDHCRSRIVVCLFLLFWRVAAESVELLHIYIYIYIYDVAQAALLGPTTPDGLQPARRREGCLHPLRSVLIKSIRKLSKRVSNPISKYIINIRCKATFV